MTATTTTEAATVTRVEVRACYAPVNAAGRGFVAYAFRSDGEVFTAVEASENTAVAMATYQAGRYA